MPFQLAPVLIASSLFRGLDLPLRAFFKVWRVRAEDPVFAELIDPGRVDRVEVKGGLERRKGEQAAQGGSASTSLVRTTWGHIPCALRVAELRVGQYQLLVLTRDSAQHLEPLSGTQEQHLGISGLGGLGGVGEGFEDSEVPW